MIDLAQPAIERAERYRPIIPDWPAFVEALGRPLPLCLWTNTLRATPSEVADQLKAEEIRASPVCWCPGAFKGPPSDRAGRSLPFVSGLYHIQEEVSLLPVVLLDPKPGEQVLDLCAAPGNKTAQTAVAMANTGTVVANDRNALRMRATRGTLDRLGVMNTAIKIEDAIEFDADGMLFDRVLLDAPCTCEGTSRKNVGAFVASGKEKSLALRERQLAMMRSAVRLCRPGGRIVYSTCTYAPEENESVIDAALREFGAMIQLVPARVKGLQSSSGITEWDGTSYHPTMNLAMRVWPHQNDSGGFFVAVLEKTGAPAESPSVSGAEQNPAALSRDKRSKWIDMLHDRFGIPESTFDPWHFHEPNRKYVFATPVDHQGVGNPVSDGMPFIRIGLRFPKLTTAAARVVGPYATKNVVVASTTQAEAYVSRMEFPLAPGQLDNIEGTGYVLIRHRGMILGVGIYFENGQRVASMFPKVLAQAVNLPIPGGS